MSQGKRRSTNRDEHDYDEKDDENGVEEMNGIIPYDIDNQISRMEDVLQYDAALAKILSSGEDDKDGEQNGFSIEKFWEQIIKLELCVCLTIKHPHVKLRYNEAMLLKSDALEHAKQKVPVLTRKAGNFYGADRADEDPDNLDRRNLTSVFSEGVFEFKVTSLSSAAREVDPPAYSHKGSTEASNEDVLTVRPGITDAEVCDYKMVLTLDEHIEKYVLLKCSGKNKFAKEREEMSAGQPSKFMLHLTEPNNYLLSCYEGLNRESLDATSSDRKPSIRQYLFLLKKDSLYIAELPASLAIKYR